MWGVFRKGCVAAVVCIVAATSGHGAEPAPRLVLQITVDQLRLVYNIEDKDFAILSADAGVDQDTEIDPTQKAAGTDGRSPRAMMTSRFSDELAIVYRERAKIFAVSVKGRGAVSMAGQAGKAFWYSKKSGEFVTSSYYYDAYPDWVAERFGLGKELISAYFHPYVYLNRDAIRGAGVDQEELERAVADEVMRLPGIALAISGTSLAKGNYPEMPMIRSVLNNYSPSRSGDVFVVFEPHSFINDLDGLMVTGHHESPWRYDTFLPLVFAGYGLEPRRVARRVETVDLAPTLSALLGIKPPSGSAGAPLGEVLAAKRR